VIPPFGLFGGKDGAPNRIYVKRKGAEDWEPVSPRYSNLPLRAGDLVRIETAIGGGFGDPFEREPELVVEDVRDGYLTREDAGTTYGVVLDEGLSPDESATASLRERLARERAERGEEERDYPKREPEFRPTAGGQS
jgi:N-methylhydantoinase B